MSNQENTNAYGCRKVEPQSKGITLPKVFAILLATKTVSTGNQTDETRIELLQSVIQGLLESFDESGVDMDPATYGTTVLGLSSILVDA